MNKKQITIDIIKDKLFNSNKKYYKEKKCNGCKTTNTKLFSFIIRGKMIYICEFCKQTLIETLHVDKLTLHKLSIRKLINQLNVQDSSSNVIDEDFGYYDVAKYNQDHKDC